VAEAKVVKNLNAPVEAVWEELGNFASVKPGGNVVSVDYKGDGVGMVRTINLSNGTIVERLDHFDPAARTFTYSIINDDGPLPFSDYSATVNVSANDDGTSTVDWTGTFEPKGVDEEKAIGIATGIYAGAIKGARIALGID